jgi:hypothetical protein
MCTCRMDGGKVTTDWSIDKADLSRPLNRNEGKSNGIRGMRKMIPRGGFAFDSSQEPYEVVPQVWIWAVPTAMLTDEHER